MSESSRLIYNSPNGDRWSLMRVDGRVLVRHQANTASGGAITDAELLDFLKAGGLGPEKQNLVQLIGTLVDNAALEPAVRGTEPVPLGAHHVE